MGCANMIGNDSGSDRSLQGERYVDLFTLLSKHVVFELQPDNTDKKLQYVLDKIGLGAVGPGLAGSGIDFEALTCMDVSDFGEYIKKNDAVSLGSKVKLKKAKVSGALDEAISEAQFTCKAGVMGCRANDGQYKAQGDLECSMCNGRRTDIRCFAKTKNCDAQHGKRKDIIKWSPKVEKCSKCIRVL